MSPPRRPHKEEFFVELIFSVPEICASFFCSVYLILQENVFLLETLNKDFLSNWSRKNIQNHNICKCIEISLLLHTEHGVLRLDFSSKDFLLNQTMMNIYFRNNSSNSCRQFLLQTIHAFQKKNANKDQIVNLKHQNTLIRNIYNKIPP